MSHLLLLAVALQMPVAADAAKPAPEAMVGVQLYVFGQPATQVADPLDGVLATAEAAKYAYIQGWLSYYATPASAKRLAEMLAKHKLSMPIAYTGGNMHVQQEADKAIESIVRQATLGAAHGLKIVAMNPDVLPREKTDEELVIQAKNLNRLGGALRAIGVRLAIHQHSPEMRSKAREWYHILRNTDSDKVFFCLDLDWVFRGKQDPYQLLQDAGKRVIDLHLRSSKQGVWSEELGDGEIDYHRVKTILDKLGYQGYYTVELAYEGQTKITRPLGEDLQRSREYVRKVLGR
ncbi:MAG: sugar phosphate isomerase/epimerase family protein [Pirellulales bacterium]